MKLEGIFLVATFGLLGLFAKEVVGNSKPPNSRKTGVSRPGNLNPHENARQQPGWSWGWEPPNHRYAPSHPQKQSRAKYNKKQARRNYNNKRKPNSGYKARKAKVYYPPPRIEKYTAITFGNIKWKFACGVIPDTNYELYHKGQEKSYHEAVNDVAPFGKYPWIAVITRDNELKCTGALVQGRFVITSSNCFDYNYEGLLSDLQSYRIRLGDWDLMTKYNEYEAYSNIEYRICQVETLAKKSKYDSSYSEYSKENDYNDVVLVTLESNANYAKYPHVKPICLPQKTYSDKSYDSYSNKTSQYSYNKPPNNYDKSEYYYNKPKKQEYDIDTGYKPRSRTHDSYEKPYEKYSYEIYDHPPKYLDEGYDNYDGYYRDDVAYHEEVYHPAHYYQGYYDYPGPYHEEYYHFYPHPYYGYHFMGYDHSDYDEYPHHNYHHGYEFDRKKREIKGYGKYDRGYQEDYEPPKKYSRGPKANYGYGEFPVDSYSSTKDEYDYGKKNNYDSYGNKNDQSYAYSNAYPEDKSYQESVCWVAGWAGSDLKDLKNHPKPSRKNEKYGKRDSYTNYEQSYYDERDNSLIQKRAMVRKIDCPYGKDSDYSSETSSVCFVGVRGYDACVADQGAPVFCIVKEKGQGDYEYSEKEDNSYYQYTDYSEDNYYGNEQKEKYQYKKSTKDTEEVIRVKPTLAKAPRYRAVLYAVVQKQAKCNKSYKNHKKQSNPIFATLVSKSVVKSIVASFWKSHGDLSCPVPPASYRKQDYY